MYAHMCIRKLRFATKKVSRFLLRELVETKSAASQIQDVVVCSDLAFEFGGNRVQPLFALLFNFQKAGFPHDLQMLGSVVLGHVQSLGNLVHAEFFFEQQPEHSETVFLPKRLERGYAIESDHAGMILPGIGGSQVRGKPLPTGLRPVERFVEWGSTDKAGSVRTLRPTYESRN